MTTPDPRQLSSNPARGWVALVPDDASVPYVGFDTTLAETHSNTAVITDHPVEIGSNVTDHIRPTPGEFSCVVFVTNTPIVAAGGTQTPANVAGITGDNSVSIDFPAAFLVKPKGAPIFTPGGAIQALGGLIGSLFGDGTPTSIAPLSFPAPFDAIQSTYEALTKLQDAGVTMSVFTSILEYPSMAIAKVEMPRTMSGGAEISLDFKRIVTVSTSSAVAPVPTVPAGVPPSSKGAQSTSGSGPPPTSVLASLAGL